MNDMKREYLEAPEGTYQRLVTEWEKIDPDALFFYRDREERQDVGAE